MRFLRTLLLIGVSAGIEGFQPLFASPRGCGPGGARTTSCKARHDPFGDFDDGDDDTGGSSWGDEFDIRAKDFKDDIQIENEADAEQPSHFFSRKPLEDPSFRKNKLFELFVKGVGITRPSKIQSLAWPVILEGNHAIVADQTGSGKTLAYLIPLLQRAMQSAAQDSGPKVKGAPRVLVLAPTAELADQTRTVCAKLSKKVPMETMVVTATGTYSTDIRDQIRRIQRQRIDILIATPGRLATILRTRKSGLDLSRLQAIVLDEVDVLLIDETFGPQLRTVGVAAPLNRTQFVFVTATLPDQVVKTVMQEFPDVVKVKGPGLHRVALTVKEHLVDVSVPPRFNRDARMCFNFKAKQLLKALRSNRCRRTLVFCNTVESCRDVENLLNRKDRRGQVYVVRAYHNAMTPDSRNENLAMFSRGKKGKNVDYILVCTDRAARGVDFAAAPVDHVVIFDFPKDPAEYVRRVGRTARAGRKGTSTVFAYGWQLPIARKIMGSKLESFTIAADDLDDDEDYEQYTRRKKRQSLFDKEKMIKGNIESGRLWSEA